MKEIEALATAPGLPPSQSDIPRTETFDNFADNEFSLGEWHTLSDDYDPVRCDILEFWEFLNGKYEDQLNSLASNEWINE